MADYTLSARITGDAKGFTGAIDKSLDKMKGMQTEMKALSDRLKGMSDAMMGAGAKLSVGVTAPLVMAGKKAVDYASDLQEVQNVVDVTFGGAAGEIDSFAKSAGKNLGLSELQAKQFSGTLGAMLKSSGLTGKGVTDMSTSLTGLSADMASFYNLEHEEAFDNIRQGISGETEGLKQLGINMSVANLEAYAMTQGINTSFNAMTQAEQAQLRYGYLMETTADAQGDFSRTSESHANVMKRLQLATANMSAVIGNLLLPYATKGASVITELVDKLQGLSPQIQQGAVMVAAVAAAMGPALVATGMLGSGIATLIAGFAFLISPIGLVVAGILGLAGVFVAAMAGSDSFRAKVTGAFSAITEKVSGFIANAIPMLQSVWSSAGEGVSSFASTAGAKLLTAFETVKSVISTVASVVVSFVSSIAGGFTSAGGQVSNLSALFLAFNPVLKIAMMILTQFGPQIAAGFQQIMAQIMPVLATLGNGLGQLAAAVIPIVMTVVGELISIIVELGGILVSTVISALPIVMGLFNNLVPIVVAVAVQLGGILNVLVPLVANLVSSLFPAIGMIAQALMNIVTSVAPAFIAIVGLIGAALSVLLPIASSILQAIIHLVTNIIQVITPLIGFIAGVIASIVAIITPIITFIAGVMTSIFQLIRPIVDVVTGVFNIVMQVISDVWQRVMVLTGGVFVGISTIISGLSSVVSGVFNGITSIISGAMNNVSRLITGVFENIRGAWKGLTTFVDGIFNGISSNVQVLVNQVKGFVNDVIGGVNAAVSLINKIPGVSISAIPMLYRGTNDWQGGFARMNEGGRGELVNLPNGAQVIPHDVSMKYAREAGKSSSGDSKGNGPGVYNDGGVHVNIANFENRTDRDIETLSHDLAWLTKRERGRLAYE